MNNMLISKNGKRYSVEEIIILYKKYNSIQKLSKLLEISEGKIKKYFYFNNLDSRKRKIYTCNENFFSEDTEKSFYWAGFIAADGCVFNNRLKISINSIDVHHLVKFKNDINANYKIYNYDPIIHDDINFKKISRDNVVIDISSKQIITDLLRFNIVENKTKIYSIPQNIIDHELFNHFLRGLIDGDGWITNSSKRSTIGLCGTPNEVNSIYNFIKEKLNINSGTYRNRPKKKNNSMILAEFNFVKLKDVKNIINYIYQNANVYLNRKYKNSIRILNSKNRTNEISKEIIIKEFNKVKHLQIQNQKYINIAQNLNVSISVVKKLLLDYKLINSLLLKQPKISKEIFIEKLNKYKGFKKVEKYKRIGIDLGIGITNVKEILQYYKLI